VLPAVVVASLPRPAVLTAARCDEFRLLSLEVKNIQLSYENKPVVLFNIYSS